MDSIAKNVVGSKTPVKDSYGSRSKIQEVSKCSENVNPNVSNSNSAKSQKSGSRSLKPMAYVQRNKIRERKFVVAKKKSKKETEGVSAGVVCKCDNGGGSSVKKCVCVAYENLRVSQEGFFKSGEMDQMKVCERAESEDIEKMIRDHEIEDEYEGKVVDGDCSVMGESDCGEISTEVQPGSSTVKRRRDKLLEEARKSVPEPGSGRVMHLVKAFEKLMTIPSAKDSDEVDDKEEDPEDENKKALKWALPGLQPKVPETQVSSSSFCPSELFLTSENLGLNSRFSVTSSWDSSQGSISSRTSNGGRRSRRNSIESSGTVGGRRWKKQQLKVTSQKPFKLRTEQRGRVKEEEFIKKVQEMMTEEEKQRVPIAQGLPWTTDEPECLIKPPVKEITRPVDLVLHSDVRAAERAEFDHQVFEKMSLIEQYKMERERQQKMAQEEEVRRLRKELVPKAQPMPYFDRPFIPRRSMKNPTIPKEPKFHIPQHKKIKCCESWNDISSSYACHNV